MIPEELIGDAAYSAMAKGHAELAKQFIMLDDTRSPRDTRYGLTPLHHAVGLNNAGMCRWILEQGCDPNAPQKHTTRSPYAQIGVEGTAAQLAVEMGNIKVAEILLEHGADLERGSKIGKPLLLSAIEHESTEMCTLLIANGADVNAWYRSNKLLELARRQGHQGVFKLLIEAGAAY